MEYFIINDLLFRLLVFFILVMLFGVIIFIFSICLIFRKIERDEVANNKDFYIELNRIQAEFPSNKLAYNFDSLKRNYIGWTLLSLSFVLPFLDMKSAVVVNILSIIAFVFSDQIAKHITGRERNSTVLNNFYDEVRKYENDFQSKSSKL